MCGIAALIGPVGFHGGAALRAMLAAVAHRGPDGGGQVGFGAGPQGWRRQSLGGQVSLGHRRLAVLDLGPAGAQPMAFDAGRYTVSYNGEIYNHQALRRELADLGHRFTHRSDTEVLLAAWAQWGRACLPRLEGMFAFVLFDRERGQLVAARDRFGIKPLYLWRSSQGLLALASEIKQFTVLPGWSARLHGERAYDFLQWRLSDHTDQTLFRDVLQVPAGHWFEGEVEDWRCGHLRARCWWSLQPDPEAAGLGEAEAAQRFGQLLEASVSSHLQADVPVGSCLSGGLDSSSVVCLAHRLRGQGDGGPRHALAIPAQAQHTFSARSAVPACDEGRFIDAVTAATGVVGHQVVPGVEGLFDQLPLLAWHQDEPFGSTSAYAQWSVFALAGRHGIKVLLDGQGADELLGGYPGYFGPRLAGLLRCGHWRLLARELQALRQQQGLPVRHSLARLADALLPGALRQALRAAAGRPSTARAPWLDLARLRCEPRDPFVAAGERRHSMQALSRAQLLATHLPQLLHCEDRNSMAHGVEARVPFLDHRLVAFTLGLQDGHKLAGGITKRVLRQAMAGVLPEPVRQRRDKLGFATPEAQWMQAHPQRFRALLAQAVERCGGIVRPGVLQAFDAMAAGRRPFSHDAWRIISFGAWVEAFSVKV